MNKTRLYKNRNVCEVKSIEEEVMLEISKRLFVASINKHNTVQAAGLSWH